MSTPTLPRPSRHRREDEFTGERHVYEPHTVGLPPLRSYLRELWRRREFAFELARTQLRAQHFDTVVRAALAGAQPAAAGARLLHPRRHPARGGLAHSELLRAPRRRAVRLQFVHNAIRSGVRSVTKGGRLILNSAFPRALLPLSAVITAFMRFVPTMIVYIPVHIASGLPVGPRHCCG